LSDNRDYRDNRDYHLYEIDRNNPWSFDETRFANISRNKKVVSVVSLFFRGDRGP
jgi:hypothetical protein